MEDKIEVGEYVRTNKGNIGQVIGIFNGHCQAKYHIQFQGKVKVKRQYLSTHTIIKHSKQPIDLIEVGDYINRMEVLDVYKPRDVWESVEIRVDSRYTNFILTEDIKTIWTKEQYMANCYKVGGEENGDKKLHNNNKCE